MVRGLSLKNSFVNRAILRMFYLQLTKGLDKLQWYSNYNKHVVKVLDCKSNEFFCYLKINVINFCCSHSPYGFSQILQVLYW